MKYLYELLDEALTWKWILFILFGFIYGWITKLEIVQISQLTAASINAWDIVLTLWSDPFFHIYFILPLWLVFSSRTIKKDWDYTVHIRIGSYWRWLLYTVRHASIILVTFLIIYSLICFIVGGIPLENKWSTYSSVNVGSNAILYGLQQFVEQPFIAFLLQVGLYSLFLLTLYIILSTIYIFIANNISLTIAAISMFLFTIVSFNMFVDIKWIQVLNYIFIYSAYNAFDSIIPSFLTLFAIIILCLLIGYFGTIKNFSNLIELIKNNYRYVVYLGLCLLGIFSFGQIHAMEPITVWDKLYLTFYGGSNEGFSLQMYIYFCIVFLGSAYLFQVKLTKILNERIYYLLIRYRSLYQWFWHQMKYPILAVGLLLIGLFCFTIGIGWMEDRSFHLELTINPAISVQEILFHFFVNGFLQIVNYLCILFIVTWIWKEHTSSIIALAVLIFIGIPTVNFFNLFPSALNSFGYLETVSAWNISIILSLYIAIELCIIFYLFRKRKILF